MRWEAGASLGGAIVPLSCCEESDSSKHGADLQLSASTPVIAVLLNPFATKNDFLWSSDADQAFAAAKPL